MKKLEQDDLSDAELDQLYRMLSKQTHPDLAGGDGSLFILLRERYLQRKAKAQEPGGAAAGTAPTPKSKSASIDPYRVIRDSGYDGALNARECLYVALNRYYGLGMYTHRMRRNDSGDRRLELVRATVTYWAERYDRAFLELFRSYDQTYHVTVTDMSYRDRLYARRCFLQALDWFFKFQEHGRSATGKIFAERAEWARLVLQRRLEDAQAIAMLAFVEWLLREYAKPPVLFKKLR